MRYLAFLALVLSVVGVESPVRAENDIFVATFNTGLHDSRGIGPLRYGWVPCVPQRRSAQLDKMERIMRDRGERPMILMLQEVWDRGFHSDLIRRAVPLGFSVTTWKASRGWGLVTLTNGAFAEPPHPYVYPRGWGRREKGMLITRIRFEKRIVTAFNTQMGNSQRKGIDADHQAQLISAAEILTTRGAAGEPAVFAGDLGTGPDHAYARIDRLDAAAFPKPNYWLWTAFSRNLASGRPRPWLDLPLASGVTWDRTKNPLIFNSAKRIGREEANFTPDHIFVSPGWAEFNNPSARSELVFNEPVPLECIEAQKEYGLGALSNHYGVMAILHFPVSNPAPVVAIAPAAPPAPPASPPRSSQKPRRSVRAKPSAPLLAYGPFLPGKDPNEHGKKGKKPDKGKKKRKPKTPKSPKKSTSPSDGPTARKARP